MAQQLKQEWNRFLNQPTEQVDILVNTDEHVMTLASTANSTIVTKLDPTGATIWETQVLETATEFALDEQKNSYILGNAVTKLSENGDVLWTHDLSSYNFTPEVIQTDEYGASYITGYTTSNAFVLKLSTSGEKVWLQSIPFAEDVTSNPKLTVGDEVYVSFSERNDRGTSTVKLLKLDKDTGLELMRKEFNAGPLAGFQHYYLEDLRWHTTESLYLFIVSSPATHTVIIKLNAEGDIVLDTTFHTEQRNYYADAALDEQGDILLLTNAQFSSGNPLFGFVTAKVDGNTGEILWHDTFDAPVGNSSTGGLKLVVLPDGKVVTLGTTTNTSSQRQQVLLLHSPTGTLLHSVFIDHGNDLVADATGNFYLVYPYSSENDATGNKLMVEKYSISESCIAPNVIVKSDFIDCETNTAQLQSATNALAATFSWTGPNGYTSDEQNPQVTEPGDYTLTITTGTNCSASSTVTVLPANTASACYTIDFENETLGLISNTQTKAGSVALMGQPRSGDGYLPQNYAAIFESGMPTGDDDDLYTDDWGKVLIINQDQTDVPNDNRGGGLLLIDFGSIVPVTMQSLKVLDIDEYEDDSWVVLYDIDENELFRTKLQPLGNNSKQTVDLGNTPNVSRVRVYLGGTEGDVGSGAIDDIKFCVESAPCQQATTTQTAIAYAAPTLFSDKTTILYKPTKTGTYEANLYDLQGNLVRQLAKGKATAGQQQQIEVHAGNLKSGLYFARIVSDSGIKTVKLIKK